MTIRKLVLWTTLFLLPGLRVIARQAKPLPELMQEFQQADKVYQGNLKAGFQLFQKLYSRAKARQDRIMQVKCMNIFAEYFWRQRKFPVAVDWGKSSIGLAEMIKADELAGDACMLTGLISYSSGNYAQAIVYYQKGISHYELLPETKRLALAFTNLGVAERKAGRYETANAAYFEAAGLFRKFNDQSGLANVYTAIGNCYSAMESYKQAVPFQLEALTIFNDLKDNQGTALVLSNLGYAYNAQKLPDSAITYLKLAIHLRTQEADSSLLVIPLQNLGSAWKQKKDLQKAIPFIQRSLAIAATYKMEEEAARGQADLAEIYLSLRRYEDADKLLRVTAGIAGKLQLADLEVTVAELSYQLQAALGHDHQALLHYKRRDHIRDSLLTDKKARAIEDLNIKYKTAERVHDIASLHARDRMSQKVLGEQRFSIIVLIIAAVLLLALLALAFYSFRAQRRGHLLVKELMKEVNHRTKNNLQILSSLLMLQIENQEDESVKRALQETEFRLHTMNIMYSKLYTGQASTTVDMAEYLNSLLTHIQEGFSHERRRVELIKDLESLSLPTDKAVLIGLVLNELSSNSISHAAAAGDLVITVSLKRKNGHEAELCIRDNGKPKIKQSKTTGSNPFGLQIVRLIVSQLEGTMETEPENPYAYRILFKI